MADKYIRRQDAVDAFEDTTFTKNEIRRRLLDIKPADVAPVVRCRDCSHYYFADNRIPQEQRYVCEISGEIWKPDSFCSYGERKE